MSVDLHDQVADQARLFMRFVATIHASDEHLFARSPAAAASANRTLEHLNALLRAASERPDNQPETADTALVGADTKRRLYGELIERIRLKVTAVVPAGSVVAVVSRGDHPLLDLPGLDGWHFPRNEYGVWAGFHPADGRHALELVTGVNAEGAQYLLVPSTGFWWLDFYEPLRDHLRNDCAIVIEDDDLMLFAFPRSTQSVAPSAATRTYDRQQVQFTRFTSALLPAGAVVAVVSRGDAALLGLEGLQARHFPADTDGRYSGTPGGDAEALAALECAIDAGSEYLAVPDAVQWWLQMFPLLHRRLLTEHTCIADRREAGSIYHLTPANQKDSS